MGRTVPSYRIALELELDKWKRFERALRPVDRKAFQDIVNSCRRFCSAASNATKTAMSEGIFAAVLLDHQKSLHEVNKRLNKWLCPTQRVNVTENIDDGMECSLEDEIKSWKGFEQALRAEDRRIFHEMMELARRHAPAIKTSTRFLISEAMFMAILLEHQKKLRRLKALTKSAVGNGRR